MKLLITCNHYAVASGRYIYDACVRLGHDVRSLGPAKGRQIWDITVPEGFAWVPNPPAKRWTPDLVIHADALWIWQPPEDRFGDCPHVVYGVDNHVQDYRHVHQPDHLFLAHGHGLRMGEDNVTWLPCAYDPAWFAGGPDWANRTVDAAMIGYPYEERMALIYGLRERMPDLTSNYGLSIYPDYQAAYRTAKLSLVRSVAGDVAQRVFETAAMGALVVMDECADCEPLGLVDNENCLMYRSQAEFFDRVRWALSHQDEAEQIAQAGQAWALPQTWDARVQTIINWVEGTRDDVTGG